MSSAARRGGAAAVSATVAVHSPKVPPHVNPSRIRCLTKRAKSPASSGRSVVYWMSRDQRYEDNWALLHAQELAVEAKVPLVVVFNLVSQFLGANRRHFTFMLKGLEEVEAGLRKHRIPFHLLRGNAVETVPQFARENGAVAVVTDMSPLRVPMGWATGVAAELDKVNVPLFQVDAHNIVPVWVASPKQETAARTFRPKVEGHLPEYLTEFIPLKENAEGAIPLPSPVNWTEALASLQLDDVPEAPGFIAGATAARKRLTDFCEARLHAFGTKRNDPNENALSGLAPYFHFGQLSPHRAALTVKEYARAHSSTSESAKSYIEESVVRRELSDNFCFYQPNYDNLKGAAQWAQDSLALHEEDQREYVYTQEQFERAQTHDELWNAAQRQMTREGKMHGFLRMYWCKKILEWTANASDALRIAIYLNDKYSLDGRDPNGYVGIMWSICGIHDMGWAERAIFGKIRFMNYAGCKRKFDVAKFESKYKAGASSITSFFPATGGGGPTKATKSAAVKSPSLIKSTGKRSAASSSESAPKKDRK